MDVLYRMRCGASTIVSLMTRSKPPGTQKQIRRYTRKTAANISRNASTTYDL